MTDALGASAPLFLLQQRQYQQEATPAGSGWRTSTGPCPRGRRCPQSAHTLHLRYESGNIPCHMHTPALQASSSPHQTPSMTSLDFYPPNTFYKALRNPGPGALNQTLPVPREPQPMGGFPSPPTAIKASKPVSPDTTTGRHPLEQVVISADLQHSRNIVKARPSRMPANYPEHLRSNSWSFAPANSRWLGFASGFWVFLGEEECYCLPQTFCGVSSQSEGTEHNAFV